MNTPSDRSNWAIEILSPHLESYSKSNKNAYYFAEAIKLLIADAKRLNWLESGPIIPIDCSQEKGVEPEFQKRARITRESIDKAMNSYE